MRWRQVLTWNVRVTRPDGFAMGDMVRVKDDDGNDLIGKLVDVVVVHVLNKAVAQIQITESNPPGSRYIGQIYLVPLRNVLERWNA